MRVSYPDPASRDEKGTDLQTSWWSETSDPPVRPVVPGRARLSDASRADSDHNPHAQVTKMAFAWSKNQTPSNDIDFILILY